MIFDDEQNHIYGFVAICIFIVVLLFDIRQFKKSKKWASFTSSVIGLTIAFGLFTTLYILKQRDNSPSKIYCVTKMNDFNGISIDFREDGTYKLTSWSLGADIYRGKYKIKDSIITIDKSKIENAITSKRFVIRQDGEIDSSGIQEKSVYQIDDQGQLIKQSVDFRVIDKKKTK